MSCQSCDARIAQSVAASHISALRETMALVQQPTSAANLLALLDEDDDSLRLYALRALNAVVHDFWFQIASAIASVEAFYEDEGFSHRELAALVASKVPGSRCAELARLACIENIQAMRQGMHRDRLQRAESVSTGPGFLSPRRAE